MLKPTIAGSLPKPAWLAKPRMLWAPWQSESEALVEAKRAATLLVLNEQPADASALKGPRLPFPLEGMNCWPVSAQVGKVKKNDPSPIEPIRLQ